MALSFASAQRSYVEQVAHVLQARGVRCFYDADEQIDLWGKYLAEELPAIYSERAATVVVFVSAEYADRDWTRLERRAALNRAVRERGEYVLPARFDDTQLPGLLSDMVAVNLRGRTPEQFAAVIAAKLAALGVVGEDGSPGENAGARMRSAVGIQLAHVTDPFVLEVHRAVQPEDALPGLPVLPPYVPREHDQVLGQVVRAAAGGRSGIAVLVGGSSTGKTRACWEALALLRDQDPAWRLWHPIDPSRPDAALAELPGIGPRTVVWLNEAQFYLDTAEWAGRAGRRRAAGAAARPRPGPGAGTGHAVARVLGHPDRPAGERRRTRTRRRGSCWPATTSPCPPRSRPRRWASSPGQGTRGWCWRPGRRRTGR